MLGRFSLLLVALVSLTTAISAPAARAQNAPLFELTWGGQGSGQGQLDQPFGIDTDVNGDVYVADTGNSRIQKFSSSGSFLLEWASRGPATGSSTRRST